MTIDAAEIARLREIAERLAGAPPAFEANYATTKDAIDEFRSAFTAHAVIALIDELEKARDESDERGIDIDTLVAERDAAHALLRDLKAWASQRPPPSERGSE